MKKLLIIIATQKKNTIHPVKMVYLFFLLIIAIASGDNVVNAQPLLRIPHYIISAKQKWVNTGIELKQGQRFSISSSGLWTNGGGKPQWVGATGWSTVHLNSTLAPALPLSSLIGRVDNTPFFVGEDYNGASPVEGQLFLSINDNDFSDNDGQLKVLISVRPWAMVEVGNGPKTQEIVSSVTSEQIQTWVNIIFSSGKLQLSQTGEGSPLSITLPDGTTKLSDSYLDFESNFIKNFDIELPYDEFTLDDIRNSGGFSVFGQYLLTHGLFFVDRFRFKINNIHASFGSDLSVGLGDQEILFNIRLSAPDPAIRGEGNGYFLLGGVIPVPLGWKDGLCPDIAMNNMRLTIHLKPFIDENHQLRLNNPEPKLEGQLTISVLDWLPLAEDIKKKALKKFEDQIANELRKDEVKKGLESALMSMIPILTGKAIDNLTSINIDPGSIQFTFSK